MCTGYVVFTLCSGGNVQKLANPAFHPVTALDATEEKVHPGKDDMTDGEKESLKEEVIGTLV